MTQSAHARSRPDGLSIRHSAANVSRSRRRSAVGWRASRGETVRGDRRRALVRRARRLAERASAAPTNSRNSGAGRSGRDLNSGWNCEATKNGCRRRQLDRLDEPLVRRGARADQAGRLEPAAQLVVDLVAVAVALVDDRLAVELADARSPSCSLIGSAPSRIVPPMSAISFCSGSRSITGKGVSGSNSVELAPSIPATWRANSRPRRACRGRSRGTGSRARARSARRGSCPRTRGRRSRPGSGSRRPRSSRRATAGRSTRLGVHPVDLDRAAVVDAGVPERLRDRQVGVLELDVLADERDPDRSRRPRAPARDRLPAVRSGAGASSPKCSRSTKSSTPSAWNTSGHLVDVGDVVGRDDRLDREAREQRDLAADLWRERRLRAAHDHVGRDPDPPQLVDRVLRRLGLQLAGVADVRAPA